ncbi:hypothetical protein ACUNV4_00130 [Granulosicoccus sp. 3-233]|uniref:hypothetical protein n=1 Tax=Granulosicoccus sp. 3-233 TaxID=3417969 RepID=UPI003D336E26
MTDSEHPVLDKDFYTMRIAPITLLLPTPLLLLSLLSACGGGGSGGPIQPANDGQSTATGENPYPNLSLNGTVTGRVFETDDARYIDLETGEMVRLPVSAVYPSHDGQYLVEHRESARFMPDGGCLDFAKWFDRISIRDSVTGRVTDEFELSESVYGPVRLSPDGQTLALVWDKSHVCYDTDAALTIFSPEGEEIVRASDTVGSYDWLPDNRLVFTVGQKIGMEVERNSFRYRTVVDMSDVPGYPSRLDVSPDGSQILFEMVTRTSLWLAGVHYRDATVWAVDVDGTNLRQVATSSREDDPDSDYDDPQVNMPVWSPDGQSILLTEGFTSGGAVWVDYNYMANVLPIIGDSLTYVLPADAVAQTLPPAQYTADGARPLLSLGSGSRVGAVTVDPLSPVMWAPAYPQPEVTSGSLPALDGRPNRGLPGSMAFLADNDDGTVSLVSVELATSTPRTLTTIEDSELEISSYTAVAADNSRSAYYVYDYGDDSLRVYDSAGDMVRDVALITGRYDYTPESAFHFSPVNNDLIAWVHDDGDFGTGVIVLNLATMAFVARWEDLDYDAIAWTAEGDLLLFDEGRAYKSIVDGATSADFAPLQNLFDFGEAISLPAVSPVNGDVAFSAGGQLFVISQDGQNPRRVIAPSDGSSARPVWSPDGNFISVEHRGNNYFVAADAQNVRLYEDHRSMGGFQLGEGSTYSQPDDSRRLSW